MLRRFSINFAVFSIIIDGIIVVASMLSMSVFRIWLNRFSFIATIPGQVKFPLWLYVVFPSLWVLILATFSIYDSKKFFKFVDEISALTVASFIASISQAGIIYLTYRSFSRALFLLIILSSYLLCVLWRIFFRLIFRIRRETLNLQHRILIVGRNPEIKKVDSTLKKNLAGTHEQVFTLDLAAFPDFSQEIPSSCPGTLAYIRDEIRHYQPTDVLVAFPRNSSDWITAISLSLDDLSLGVWVALDYFDLSLANTYVENLGGLPLLDLRNPALDEYSRVVKRIFDLVMATFLIIFFLPLMLLTAIIVLADSGWPILFLQTRVGENGRLFKMIKFRTMVRNAEELRTHVEHIDENGEIIYKSPNDPRVTRAGKLLRRFSLDELPQFFNVIAGTMSLVGPRPELPYLVQNYQHWQRRRLSVPPGLTGWWQVNGRSDNAMHLHTEDDIYYIENYSIWLDLRILIRTIWVVIFGNGAY